MESSIRKKRQRTSINGFSGTYTDLRGYCHKQSTKGKWQKRWFQANDHYLIYKSTEKSLKVLGSIDLLTVGDIQADPNIKDGFSLELVDRVYRLRTTKKAPLANQWVAGLQARQKFKETAVGAAQDALALATANAARRAASAAAADAAAVAASGSAGTTTASFPANTAVTLTPQDVDVDTRPLSNKEPTSTGTPPKGRGRTGSSEADVIQTYSRSKSKEAISLEEKPKSTVVKSKPKACCVIA